jgi:Alcohol dehydrogenase GroES-like domain
VIRFWLWIPVDSRGADQTYKVHLDGYKQIRAVRDPFIGKSAMPRAVQVARAGGSLEFLERDVPEPAHGEVRVRVEACGVCHSDSFTVEGQFPGLSFPGIPGPPA